MRGNGLPLDNSSTVGRVVHIRPAIPHRAHETIPLPTEILLSIFQNFSESSHLNSRWRRDLLSCGLVCKQWGCALDLRLLLSDFHYPVAQSRQRGYPPEISTFVNALTLYPGLALSITHLSPDYFLEHTLWRTLASSPPFQPRVPRQRTSSLVVARHKQFFANFLSILRLAKNLRSLSFSFLWNASPLDEFIDALRELDKIEAIDVTGGFNAVHQVYLSASQWPSLKHLRIRISEQSEPVPVTPPRYVLVDAHLSATVRDDYLNYVLSASSSSLKRLVLDALLELTNAGLHSALLNVSKCLVTLRIVVGGALPGKDEEHALDSLITQMVCLEYLEITPTIATHLMIERWSEAFKRSYTSSFPAMLPIINLRILASFSILPQTSRKRCSILVAASQAWAGWAIGVDDGSD